MSGPIAPEHLIEGLAAHIAAYLEFDISNKESAEGVDLMARAAVDYFSSSVAGAPPGGGGVLLWAIFSALWSGKVPQEEIDRFFGSCILDPERLLGAWRALHQEDPTRNYVPILVPADLKDSDIYHITQSLFQEAIRN